MSAMFWVLFHNCDPAA